MGHNVSPLLRGPTTPASEPYPECRVQLGCWAPRPWSTQGWGWPSPESAGTGPAEDVVQPGIGGGREGTHCLQVRPPAAPIIPDSFLRCPPAPGQCHSESLCPGLRGVVCGRGPGTRDTMQRVGYAQRACVPGAWPCVWGVSRREARPWLVEVLAEEGTRPTAGGGALPTAGPCLHHLQPGELQVRKPLGGSSSTFLEEPVSVPGRQLRCRRVGPHPSQPPASPGAARDDLQCRGNRIKCKDQES